MVIEAKFTIPDPVVYWRLQTTDHLAGYSLSTTQVKPVWDTYLDTERHQILAAGYSCQQSLTHEGILITLKSLGGAEGAVHRRRKCELSMATSRPPVDWPEDPVRDLVLFHAWPADWTATLLKVIGLATLSLAVGLSLSARQLRRLD